MRTDKVLLAALLGLALAACDGMPFVPHSFTIGDCRAPGGDAWARVQRIEFVGKAHYRTRTWTPENGWNNLTCAWPMNLSLLYEKVPCPPGAPPLEP